MVEVEAQQSVAPEGPRIVPGAVRPPAINPRPHGAKEPLVRASRNSQGLDAHWLLTLRPSGAKKDPVTLRQSRFFSESSNESACAAATSPRWPISCPNSGSSSPTTTRPWPTPSTGPTPESPSKRDAAPISFHPTAALRCDATTNRQALPPHESSFPSFGTSPDVVPHSEEQGRIGSLANRFSSRRKMRLPHARAQPDRQKPLGPESTQRIPRQIGRR